MSSSESPAANVRSAPTRAARPSATAADFRQRRHGGTQPLLQRHRPPALRAPRRQVADERRRQQVAVHHEVREQVLGDTVLADSIGCSATMRRCSTTSASGAHSPAASARSPTSPRTAPVDEDVPAVRRHRVPRASARGTARACSSAVRVVVGTNPGGLDEVADHLLRVARPERHHRLALRTPPATVIAGACSSSPPAAARGRRGIEQSGPACIMRSTTAASATWQSLLAEGSYVYACRAGVQDRPTRVGRRRSPRQNSRSAARRRARRRRGRRRGGRVQTRHGTRRSTRVVSPTPGFTRFTSLMLYLDDRLDGAQPAQSTSARRPGRASHASTAPDVVKRGDRVEEASRRRPRAQGRRRTSRRGTGPGR